jgi:hypothetical protein
MESDVEVNLIFVWNHQNQDLGGSIFGIKIIGTSHSFGSFYDPNGENIAQFLCFYLKFLIRFVQIDIKCECTRIRKIISKASWLTCCGIKIHYSVYQ